MDVFKEIAPPSASASPSQFNKLPTHSQSATSQNASLGTPVSAFSRAIEGNNDGNPERGETRAGGTCILSYSNKEMERKVRSGSKSQDPVATSPPKTTS